MNDTINRQQAIEALEKVARFFPYKIHGKSETYDRYNEAWNDAIGRAELEINELPPAQLGTNLAEVGTDCISRQSVVDALEKAKQNIRHNIERAIGDAVCEILDAVEDGIKQLPFIQSEPCEDAISRNIIIQKLNKMDRYVSTELRLCDTDKKFPQNEVFIVDDVYEEIVEQLPSIQPEIIRCKDCKYGILDCDFPHERYCDFKGNDWNNDDHFCGHAKRREVTT